MVWKDSQVDKNRMRSHLLRKKSEVARGGSMLFNMFLIKEQVQQSRG